MVLQVEVGKRRGGTELAREQILQALIEPVVEGLGYKLWGIEHLAQGRHSALKVYIDAEEGINVEDCARVSRQVSSLLDVEDPIGGQYMLEVSSPGLDRRLFTRAQYEAYVGARIRVSLKRPYEGRRRFTGLLAGLEGDDVVVRVSSDEECLFPLTFVERANIIPDR